MFYKVSRGAKFSPSMLGPVHSDTDGSWGEGAVVYAIEQGDVVWVAKAKSEWYIKYRQARECARLLLQRMLNGSVKNLPTVAKRGTCLSNKKSMRDLFGDFASSLAIIASSKDGKEAGDLATKLVELLLAFADKIDKIDKIDEVEAHLPASPEEAKGLPCLVEREHAIAKLNALVPGLGTSFYATWDAVASMFNNTYGTNIAMHRCRAQLSAN